jgi:hypothetical protein
MSGVKPDKRKIVNTDGTTKWNCTPIKGDKNY